MVHYFTLLQLRDVHCCTTNKALAAKQFDWVLEEARSVSLFLI